MLAIKHVALAAVVVCLMASVTFGGLTTGFEAPDYNGSAAGVQLTDGNTAGGPPGGPAAPRLSRAGIPPLARTSTFTRMRATRSA